jgi:hypothetical protein
MFGLGRRRLAADRRPPLEPTERILAWAGTTGDDVVVVTNRGMWLPGRDRRLGWHEIHKATWSGRELTLVPARAVAEYDDYCVVVDLPPAAYPMPDPDRVPEQVRTRVTRSIAYSAHHRLPGDGGARVVARRVSGVDGLRWTVRFDPGTAAESPEIQAVTRQLVAQGKAGTGVPAG